MKAIYYVLAWIVVVIIAVFVFMARHRHIVGSHAPVPAGALSLIVEPDDGIAPVLAMIGAAKKSLDIAIYQLDDVQIEAALVSDEARGVAVRVILSRGYAGATSTMNAATYDFLMAHGVPVRWSPPYFSLTHEKSLVTDGDRAVIMTFNLVSKYYATGRDFGIVDADPRDVMAIEHTFGADWNGSGAVSAGVPFGSGNDGDGGDDLVWSPGARPALIDLIHGAKRSLSIYNEEMEDPIITKALIDAARRGVEVFIDMTGADEWKWQFAELTTAGVHVRTYADAPEAPLYIHAKVIVADAGSVSARAFIGSENFSTGSLDNNRELGIMVSNQGIIASLMRTFTADWRGATPFGM
jgi:phosphatidylserine/phosphatidylglycerophosphate/cardiolipin synthase-like enzyme